MANWRAARHARAFGARRRHVAAAPPPLQRTQPTILTIACRGVRARARTSSAEVRTRALRARGAARSSASKRRRGGRAHAHGGGVAAEGKGQSGETLYTFTASGSVSRFQIWERSSFACFFCSSSAPCPEPARRGGRHRGLRRASDPRGATRGGDGRYFRFVRSIATGNEGKVAIAMPGFLFF